MARIPSYFGSYTSCGFRRGASVKDASIGRSMADTYKLRGASGSALRDALRFLRAPLDRPRLAGRSLLQTAAQPLHQVHDLGLPRRGVGFEGHLLALDFPLHDTHQVVAVLVR